jgi:hypothetical protein
LTGVPVERRRRRGGVAGVAQKAGCLPRRWEAQSAERGVGRSPGGAHDARADDVGDLHGRHGDEQDVLRERGPVPVAAVVCFHGIDVRILGNFRYILISEIISKFMTI